MPVALDTEMEIVAALTDASACAVYYRQGLSGEHFADDKARAVYEWGMDYFLTHGRMERAATENILTTEFSDYPSLVEQAGGAAPSYLAARLKGEYVRRQTNALVKSVLPKMADAPMDGAVKLREGMSAIVDACTSTDEVMEYGEDMEGYRRKLAEIREHTGAPYPFKEMQEHTGGIHEGEMAVVVGAPGRGKTLLACKTALEAVKQGFDVFFATLELPIETITGRMELMLVNEDGMRVPAFEYASGRRTPEQEIEVQKAQDELAAMPGRLVVSQPRVEDRTPSAIVQACKAHGCGFLIVDQLQFVKRPKRDSLQESYGAALQEFKQQIMTPVDNIRLPMMLLHQMNRGGAKLQRENVGKVGSMTDIAGSAWVEQISDVVWGIGQSDEERNNDIMNLATLKTRSIAPIGWQLSWDTNLTYQFDILRDEQGNARRLERW